MLGLITRADIDMVSKKDLLLSFDIIDEYAGCLFFKYEMPKAVVQYCLRSTEKQDLLVVCEGAFDREFAVQIIRQSPVRLNKAIPGIFEISMNSYGFTHALVVPNNYHGILKGEHAYDRDKLLLCIPIYRSEFSGGESEFEFKEMIRRTVPVYRWDRDACPKITVYFDNPRTGGGSDESGILMRYVALLAEIENLEGVVNGFVEITNYKGEVIEVISPKKNEFVLIRDRKDEEFMTYSALVVLLNYFVMGAE